MSGPLGSNVMMQPAGGVSNFYDHQIDQSVRYDTGDGTRIRRTVSSAGSRTTWAISMWIKRANLGSEVFLYEAGVAKIFGPGTAVSEAALETTNAVISNNRRTHNYRQARLSSE